jgi:hypothetical protein
MEPINAQSQELAARARRAYEFGRARFSLRLGLLVIPFVAIAMATACHPRWPVTCSLGGLLFVLVAGLLFRGQVFGRAAMAGLAAGLVPFALPILLRGASDVCAFGICVSGCMLACVAGGLVAGKVVARFATRFLEHRSLFVLSATTVAGFSGSLACTLGGMSGVFGMLAGAALTSLPVLFFSTKKKGVAP